MSNHLAGESSPYLLQHADNPVDWYPWGDEALERARDEDKPIFLSIGYSACHWCHVMERESFTDPQTAAFLNEHFVSIKVDREERPDLDDIYMEAVTALTGSGGWPLSVWLTPEGEPFYGGTYFPPSPRYGHGLRSGRCSRRLADSVDATAETSCGEAAPGQLREHLRQRGLAARPTARAAGSCSTQALRESARPRRPGQRRLGRRARSSRSRWRSSSCWPVRPSRPALICRPAVERTLDAMAAGGIYDHLGGGFHRYATDDAWLVPHFEKMLYDNAQLARCYLHAWQLTGKPRYREVAEETLDYLLRRMSHPDGGFFSAEDADSEGAEGAFYTWTLDELEHRIAGCRGRADGPRLRRDRAGQLRRHRTCFICDPLAAATPRPIPPLRWPRFEPHARHCSRHGSTASTRARREDPGRLERTRPGSPGGGGLRSRV